MAALLEKQAMPVGTHHQETGVLIEDANQLLLRRDHGGHWRLDAPRGSRRLLGQRVQICGTRTGFDWLDVESISTRGEIIRTGLFSSWQFSAGVATILVILSLIMTIAGWLA
jgi:hypothetical protein